MKDKIVEILKESIGVKEKVIEEQVEMVARIAEAVISAIEGGGKVILFGNGGSAADAQHLAAELLVRFTMERRPLPAVALSTNTSVITAIANDYTFDLIFARQVEAIGTDKDIAIGISTSGRSKNVIEGVLAAKRRGLKTVGLTGEDGGDLASNVDLCLKVPSTNTARIQEAHITIGHIICELVEEAIFLKEKGI